MPKEAMLREHKFRALNTFLPSAFDQIEVNVEYIIYNTLFLQECIKDFERAFHLLKDHTRVEEVISEAIPRAEGASVFKDKDGLIKELQEAVNDCLDGLREILRSISGLRGFVDDLEPRDCKKQVVDLNDALVNLVLALKQQWHPAIELSMELDTNPLPFECVKSDLYYVFAMCLLYHTKVLNECVSTNPNKGLLLIKTTALDSHNEVRIACQACSGLSEYVSPSIESRWNKVFQLIRQVIVTDCKGTIETAQKGEVRETIITFPVP